MPISKERIRKFVKMALIPVYLILNTFYFPLLKRWVFKRLSKVSKGSQLFFMARADLGACLMLMHYAQCWHRSRGSACLVVFSIHATNVIPLRSFVCPDVEMIACNGFFLRILLAVFRKGLVQFYTLNRIYAYAVQEWPHALYLHDIVFSISAKENVSRYIEAFDPILQTKWPFSDSFRNTYRDVRKKLDYRRFLMKDMFDLHYRYVQLIERALAFPAASRSPRLFQALELSEPYVVMNLNTKDYKTKIGNSRRINFPERYNSVVDLLIERGFQVVLQGRSEQPNLGSRKGLVEYFKSSLTSPVHDYDLYKNAAFAINCKTGPEVFSAICNVPSLGLNYAEIAHIIPHGRSRFFPKHIFDSKKQMLIHWTELLQRPCFFHIGSHCAEHDIEFIELEEEELVAAVEEFLPLISLPHSEWLRYTPLQKKFREALHPAHLDLHDALEVPCETYLASKKYHQPC